MASGSDLGRLKELLFRPEQAKIAALQGQCDAFAQKIGDDARFEASTAQVIAGALRKAEVARHRELSAAIAPLVVAAIRSEIVNSRDMMVDALYPITGRLVAAAVANAFRELAQNLEKRIDALLSTELWRLRLRALITRRPLSEVVLEAARRPQVVRLLALERDTGRVLANWRADGQADESVELVSGLIAAISQFSAQAFAREHGELRELDLGASHILLRASAKTLVAAEFSGVPHVADARRMDGVLFDLIEAGGPLGAGDLARLAERFAVPEVAARSGASRWILVGLIASVLAGAVYFPVRDALRARRIEAAFAEAQAAQNLLAWPLTLAIDPAGKILVRGLAPAKADLDALAQALAPAAAPFAVDMRVARLDEPAPPVTPDPERAKARARIADLEARVAELGAQVAEFKTWRAAREEAANAPAARLARVSGASAINFTDEIRLKEPEKASQIIAALAEALKASGRGLRVVGYTDSTGVASKNHALSLARAAVVVNMLVAAGVAPAKLVAVGRGDQAPVLDEGGPERVGNRRVVFELLDGAAE